MPENHFEPRILAFFCTWCTYTASDLAGMSRLQYAPNVRVVRLMCSGRLDPQFVLAALRHGADGVLVGGCHPGDCHYQEGNYKTRRRMELLRGVLRDLGVEDERVRLEWISASEGEKVQRVCNEMTAQLRRLGPLRLASPARPAREAAADVATVAVADVAAAAVAAAAGEAAAADEADVAAAAGEAAAVGVAAGEAS